MTNDRRSLMNLAPDFAIPTGTQVVLTADQKMKDGSIRKSGSVGIVTKAPPDNDQPYLIRFNDET